MKKIAVLGAGSWGSALAMVLADNKHDVRLWGINAEQIEEINTLHTNKNYLPDGVILPNNIKGYTDLPATIDQADLIVFAVPSKAFAEVAGKVVDAITEPTYIVHVSKGIDPDTLQTNSEILATLIPRDLYKEIVVLSGPSHAEEVSKRMITAICATANDSLAAELVQDVFNNDYFRVYTNDDVIGVELAGALKNIIAIGSGIIAGLQLGDNAKAALITRGLAEITKLSVKMGASPYTFLGLTGLGDLIVTCTSVHSRNWRCGYELGKGKPLAEIVDNMGMVVEGVRTTKAAYQLAEKHGVEMPITTTLYNMLFNDLNVKEATAQLMSRDKKPELEKIF